MEPGDGTPPALCLAFPAILELESSAMERSPALRAGVRPQCVLRDRSAWVPGSGNEVAVHVDGGLGRIGSCPAAWCWRCPPGVRLSRDRMPTSRSARRSGRCLRRKCRLWAGEGHRGGHDLRSRGARSATPRRGTRSSSLTDSRSCMRSSRAVSALRAGSQSMTGRRCQWATPPGSAD